MFEINCLDFFKLFFFVIFNCLFFDATQGARRVRPRRVGPNPEKVGARRVGARNFALFSPSPAAKFVLFFPLWAVFSWNFGGVLKRRDAQMCVFEFSGCRVRAPAARSGGT